MIKKIGDGLKKIKNKMEKLEIGLVEILKGEVISIDWKGDRGEWEVKWEDDIEDGDLNRRVRKEEEEEFEFENKKKKGIEKIGEDIVEKFERNMVFLGDINGREKLKIGKERKMKNGFKEVFEIFG